MMRALILLSLAGFAAYMLVPASVERAGEKVSTARLEPIPQDPLPQNPLPQGERQLRSWGSTLQSLSSDSQGRTTPEQAASASGALRQDALYQPDIATETEASPPMADTGAPLAAATAVTTEALPDGAHVAWAKVIHGARAHSAASISSPVTKFYPQGKELPIVGRESGWVELLDPETQERGFVFEKYLVAIDGPNRSEALTQAKAEPLPIAASPIAAVKAQTPRFAAKPMQAMNEAVPTRPDELASEGQHNRAAKKEERRQRKLFRLFGRNAGPEAWTVGSPR